MKTKKIIRIRISMIIRYGISIIPCLIIILASSCSSYITLDNLKIGEKIPREIAKSPSKQYLLTSSSDLEQSYETTLNGIRYSIAIDENKRITYIGSFDPDFKTEEGYSIKTTFKEIFTSINKIELEPGWAFYVPLRLGWNAAFKLSKAGAESKPKDDDKVGFFFKRD